MASSAEILGLEPDLLGDIDADSLHVTDLADQGLTVDAETLAKFTKLSDRKVRDLAQNGIMVKVSKDRYDLAASLVGYCNHLRTVAAGRGGEEAQLRLTQERARLAKEQADSVALKNAKEQGELVPADEIEREWSGILRQVRNQVMSVPERIRMQVPNLTAQGIETIDSIVRRALEDIADDNA